MLLFPHPFKNSVAESLRELLSTKHLYQKIEIPESAIDKVAAMSEMVQWKAKTLAIKDATSEWEIRPVKNPAILPNDPIPMLNIRIYCDNCENLMPFSAISSDSTFHGASSSKLATATIGQVFRLSYKCEGCSTNRVDFMVVRSVLKMTIAGRWPISHVEVPSFVPNVCKKYYSGSIIASHTNNHLAAIFLLRTAIEQFWVSMGLRPNGAKVSGDKMATEYKKTTPSDLNARFPTLGEIYETLSEGVHAAKADETSFREAVEKFNEHFDARRLFKLPLNPKSTN